MTPIFFIEIFLTTKPRHSDLIFTVARDTGVILQWKIDTSANFPLFTENGAYNSGIRPDGVLYLDLSNANEREPLRRICDLTKESLVNALRVADHSSGRFEPSRGLRRWVLFPIS